MLVLVAKNGIKLTKNNGERKLKKKKKERKRKKYSKIWRCLKLFFLIKSP